MSTKCCLTTRYSEVNENSLKKCIQAIEAWIENEPPTPHYEIFKKQGQKLVLSDALAVQS